MNALRRSSQDQDQGKARCIIHSDPTTYQQRVPPFSPLPQATSWLPWSLRSAMSWPRFWRHCGEGRGIMSLRKTKISVSLIVAPCCCGTGVWSHLSHAHDVPSQRIRCLRLRSCPVSTLRQGPPPRCRQSATLSGCSVRPLQYPSEVPKGEFRGMEISLRSSV